MTSDKILSAISVIENYREDICWNSIPNNHEPEDPMADIDADTWEWATEMAVDKFNDDFEDYNQDKEWLSEDASFEEIESFKKIVINKFKKL